MLIRAPIALTVTICFARLILSGARCRSGGCCEEVCGTYCDEDHACHSNDKRCQTVGEACAAPKPAPKPATPSNQSCLFSNFMWNARAAPSAHTFTSECYRPRTRTELCSAFAERGIKRVLYYGDSTMTNLFVSSIYDLIPRAGPRDDTPGQVALGDLATARAARPGACPRCHRCVGSLVHNMKRAPEGGWPEGHQARDILYPERDLITSPCAHAQRCDGAIELEAWRGAIADWDAMFDNLNASLAELVARRRAPDAVVFSAGTHYMAKRGDLMSYSSALDQITRLFLDLPGLRAAVFVTQLGSTPKKPGEYRLMQSSCEIGKLNAQAFALMRARGVPIVDSLALSHRIPDAHCMDGTHWDAWTLAAQGSLAFQALLSRAQHNAPWRAASNDTSACALVLHRVTLTPDRSAEGSWKAPRTKEAQMLKKLSDFCSEQKRAFGQVLPACVIDPTQFFGNKTVTVSYSCVGCSEHCGEDSRECGRSSIGTRIKSGQRHKTFYCPAWYGSAECGGSSPSSSS